MLNYIMPIKGIAKVLLLFRQGLSLPTMLRNKQSMQPADNRFCYSSSYLLIYSHIYLFIVFWFLFLRGMR